MNIELLTEYSDSLRRHEQSLSEATKPEMKQLYTLLIKVYVELLEEILTESDQTILKKKEA